MRLLLKISFAIFKLSGVIILAIYIAIIVSFVGINTDNKGQIIDNAINNLEIDLIFFFSYYKIHR